MPLYRDEGVVLRTAKLGEADRIITLLTRDNGKVRAVAKGVRKPKSRFGGRLEPFMRDDLLIATGRTFDVISQVESVSTYAAAICRDYDAYAAANVVVETVDRLVSAEHERVLPQYRLLCGALHALATAAHAPQAIADSYVLRALALAGWSPRLDVCVSCGRRYDGDAGWRCSIASGGLVCPDDRSVDAVGVTRSAIRQAQALLAGDWPAFDNAVADTVADVAPAAVPDTRTRELVEEWSSYILERPIRSLRLLDS